MTFIVACCVPAAVDAEGFEGGVWGVMGFAFFARAAFSLVSIGGGVTRRRVGMADVVGGRGAVGGDLAEGRFVCAGTRC